MTDDRRTRFALYIVFLLDCSASMHPCPSAGLARARMPGTSAAADCSCTPTASSAYQPLGSGSPRPGSPHHASSRRVDSPDTLL